MQTESPLFRTYQTTAAAVVWMREELRCQLIAAEVPACLDTFHFLSNRQMSERHDARRNGEQVPGTCRYDLVGVATNAHGQLVIHVVEVKGTLADYNREYPFSAYASVTDRRKRSSHAKWENTFQAANTIQNFWLFHGPFFVQPDRSPPPHWVVVPNRGTYEAPTPIHTQAARRPATCSIPLMASALIPIGQRSIEPFLREHYVRFVGGAGPDDARRNLPLEERYVLNTATMSTAWYNRSRTAVRSPQDTE